MISHFIATRRCQLINDQFIFIGFILSCCYSVECFSNNVPSVCQCIGEMMRLVSTHSIFREMTFYNQKNAGCYGNAERFIFFSFHSCNQIYADFFLKHPLSVRIIENFYGINYDFMHTNIHSSKIVSYIIFKMNSIHIR